MKADKDFFDKVYHLIVQNRFKFFLKIWHQGAFLNDLIKTIPVTGKESIYGFAKVVQDEGFLTISDQYNSTTGNQDKLIIISDENFEQIVSQVCTVCHYPFNKELYEKLLNDKKTYDSFSTTEFPLKMSDSEKINRNHIGFAESEIGYLFLVLLSIRTSIINHQDLYNFVVKCLDYKLKPLPNDFYMNFGYYH